MRSARFLLACLALSALAACGSDVTAPAAPATPNLDSGTTTGGGTSTVEGSCIDGSVIEVCLESKQTGSGG